MKLPSPMLGVAAGLLLLVAPGCASRRIPGTDILDNDDTRAILQVMERYRAALEARDAGAIRGLVAESFRDDAGTDALDDDLTYANLADELPARLERLEQVRIELNVRRIAVQEDRAAAIYYWNASYRTPKLTDKAHQESELEQMVFERVGGAWKIVSGL